MYFEGFGKIFGLVSDRVPGEEKGQRAPGAGPCVGSGSLQKQMETKPGRGLPRGEVRGRCLMWGAEVLSRPLFSLF